MKQSIETPKRFSSLAERIHGKHIVSVLAGLIRKINTKKTSKTICIECNKVIRTTNENFSSGIIESEIADPYNFLCAVKQTNFVTGEEDYPRCGIKNNGACSDFCKIKN
jgi:hypothetical protein